MFSIYICSSPLGACTRWAGHDAEVAAGWDPATRCMSKRELKKLIPGGISKFGTHFRETILSCNATVLLNSQLKARLGLFLYLWKKKSQGAAFHVGTGSWQLWGASQDRNTGTHPSSECSNLGKKGWGSLGSCNPPSPPCSQCPESLADPPARCHQCSRSESRRAGTPGACGGPRRRREAAGGRRGQRPRGRRGGCGSPWQADLRDLSGSGPALAPLSPPLAAPALKLQRCPPGVGGHWLIAGRWLTSSWGKSLVLPSCRKKCFAPMGNTQHKSNRSLSGRSADAPEAARARCPPAPARRDREPGALPPPTRHGTERSRSPPSPAPLRAGGSQRGAAAFETQPHITSSANAVFLRISPTVASDRTQSEVKTKHSQLGSAVCVSWGPAFRWHGGTAELQLSRFSFTWMKVLAKVPVLSVSSVLPCSWCTSRKI